MGTHCEVGDGGFAGTGMAHERGDFVGLECQVEVFEYCRAAVVFKLNAFECDFYRPLGQRSWCGGFIDVDGCVEDFKHTFAGGAAGRDQMV